jgi:transcription elongation factor GreA
MTTGMINISQAVSCYLVEIGSDSRGKSQVVLFKFSSWFGQKKMMKDINPPEISRFADQLTSNDKDYQAKLAIVRNFLNKAYKEKWTTVNLSSHLKVKKVAASKLKVRGEIREVILSAVEKQSMESELENLKKQRLYAIEEIKNAAADKDFRENAPLDAAKEKRAYLEGKIQELESNLKLAKVIDPVKRRSNNRISLGDEITLYNLFTGERLTYFIVKPREVNPLNNRISEHSPLGKALINHMVSDEIRIKVPAGELRYKIEKILKALQ